MANDSMGNLEKLGILVIVILVVVVGVVAITPSKTLFQQDPDPQDLEIDLANAEAERGTRGEATERDPWPFDRSGDLASRDVENGGGAATPAPLPLPVPVDQPGPIDQTGPVDPPVQRTRLPLVPPTPAPEPVAVQPVAPPTPAPTPAATPRFREYVVQSGDSLSAIAGRQNPPMRWTDIYRANPGIDANAIKPGQILKIPVAAAGGATAIVGRERGGAASRRTPAAQPAGAARTHVVRKGESLSTIAGRLLGSRKRWRAIYDANRDVISDPDRVPAGLTLRIPSSSGTTSRAGARRDLSSNVGAALPRFADVPAGAGHTYKVQRGDNLSRIAARFLGDADRWREIYDANRDTISAPEKLPAGATIRIP